MEWTMVSSLQDTYVCNQECHSDNMNAAVGVDIDIGDGAGVDFGADVGAD